MKLKITSLLAIFVFIFPAYVLAKPVEAADKEAVSITLTDTYAWRNWQPIVPSPGVDGGSAMMIKAYFSFENKTDLPVQVTWKSGLKKKDNLDSLELNNITPVFLSDSDSSPAWAGALAAGELKNVLLRTYDGPYLSPRTKIQLETTFTVRSALGLELQTIKSSEVEVEDVY